MTRQLLLAGTALLLATSAGLAQDVKQGGSMIVTYKDDVSTLDPAIGYDWQNWSMIKSLFDRLMDYKPGTTELRAERPDETRADHRRFGVHRRGTPREMDVRS